jgi:hypothetical protein
VQPERGAGQGRGRPRAQARPVAPGRRSIIQGRASSPDQACQPASQHCRIAASISARRASGRSTQED